jgi:hypothetical protein
MLTRKEFCQIILMKAQKQFGKTMTELDVYYTPPEVGMALSYLGFIQDESTLHAIDIKPCPMFKHPNGKELSYFEFLAFLPQENTVVKKDIKENKEQITEKTEKIENPQIILFDEAQIKELLGDRKYFRVSDAIETLKGDELVIVAQLLKLRFESLQSPAA